MDSARRKRVVCPRRASAGVVIALGVCAGACQQYRPAPVDPGVHRAAFLARTPESAEVASYAEALRGAGGEAHGVFDLTDGIDPWEAEAVAMVFNADLRVARARAGIAAASAEEAGLWEDPVIGVDLSRIVESATHPWKTFGAVGLTIPISGRLELEKRRAGGERDAELAGVGAAEWETRIAIRREWIRWEALEAQAGVAREFLARVDELLGIVDLMERSGEISRTESRLFRIERASTMLELATVEADRADAALGIARLMGLSPAGPVVLMRAGLDADRWGVESEGAGGAATVVERSPRVGVALAEYEVAERTLEMEIRAQFPDVQIGPGFGREDGQNQVTMGLAVPIPILNANRRAIAEALAGRDAARAVVEQEVESALADLTRAETHLRAARDRRRTLEAEIVPLVDAQYADARAIARLGEVNTLVLLESLKRQREAKARLIEARADESLSALRVAEVSGPAWMREMGEIR